MYVLELALSNNRAEMNILICYCRG